MRKEEQLRRQLDAIDLRILSALRRNARLSHSSLGDEVNLSRNAVRQRIERLERDGHISGYTIVEKVEESSTSVMALLLIDRNDRMRGGEVVEILRSIPEIVRCDVVAGELDLVAHVEAAETARVSEIWQLLAKHPGVRDITTAMSLTTVIDRTHQI
ncbi:Lrp/AsnC family transcriptional regulator [Brevibacterium zhoupengii]|uniref:Lrp/AsnC family transcriptional regulator n=1 Tax=Brevibacterium zhoupengii TaxID=2898795 RepID=UPI001E4151A7|nr:Lrp/AsnC family transcriptional regulator [Brevibacterium zhoupengii]